MNTVTNFELLLVAVALLGVFASSLGFGQTLAIHSFLKIVAGKEDTPALILVRGTMRREFLGLIQQIIVLISAIFVLIFSGPSGENGQTLILVFGVAIMIISLVITFISSSDFLERYKLTNLLETSNQKEPPSPEVTKQ